jgi:hypothetical protein
MLKVLDKQKQIDFLRQQADELEASMRPERLEAENAQLKRELGHAVSAVHEQRKARWAYRPTSSSEATELKRQVSARDAEIARLRKERDLAVSRQTYQLPLPPGAATYFASPPEPTGNQALLASALRYAHAILDNERRGYTAQNKMDLEAMSAFAKDWSERIPAEGPFSALGLYWWALALTASLLRVSSRKTFTAIEESIRKMHIQQLEQWASYMKQRAAWELTQPATAFLPSHKG